MFKIIKEAKVDTNIKEWVKKNFEGYDEDEMVNAIVDRTGLGVVDAENLYSEIASSYVTEENIQGDKFMIRRPVMEIISPTNVGNELNYQPELTDEEKYMLQAKKAFKQRWGRDPDMENKEDKAEVEHNMSMFGFKTMNPMEIDKVGKEQQSERQKEEDMHEYFDEVEDKKNDKLVKPGTYKRPKGNYEESFKLIKEEVEEELDEAVEEDGLDHGNIQDAIAYEKERGF
jgi:hypothetical protein